MEKANIFKCPSWLDKEAKKEWKRILKELENEDLKALDVKALEGYCQSYSKWKKSEEYLQEKGNTFETPNGYIMPRPEVAIANKAQAEMRAWAKELGLTPASRTRMKPNATPSEEIDEEMEGMIVK
jgi:P27 family predicted phage terminase small subunit